MGTRMTGIPTQLEGEKEVKEKEHVPRREEHFKELLWLASTPNEAIELESMRKDIERLGSRRFEHLYKEQHSRSKEPL